MSDLMRQIPFGQLMQWAIKEYEKEGSVFGVRKFFSYKGDPGYEIFGSKLELPFGPAAGPHTQLAQNLIAGYVAGARFFELKTVQVLDGEELPVSKPCISASDEGYNVEWSTELYVPQALDEYVKGYFALKLLSCEFELGNPDGFIFNMSVGYDLDGIMTSKIDNFIEGLKNAETTDSWNTCKEWALSNTDRFKNVDKSFIENIKPEICNSITLSTLHGCPPEEIERIATYLLKEKGLHTYIKCNPTLLGYDFARNTLDSLGFGYMSFDDSHFKADLQIEDAIPMLKRLQTQADSLSLEFGVKVTNTFPVRIEGRELPGDEMYMSGRALFPLSIEVANRLSKIFEGKLRISFSGGADVRNISDILDAGIWPITIATTLLKPGGYERLHQIVNRLLKVDGMQLDKVDKMALQSLQKQSLSEPLYRKREAFHVNRKINEKVPLTDCFIAPCKQGCPFGQDVPAYLRLVGEGQLLEALKIIAVRNPLPLITGTICSHNCMTKCIRQYYESAVDIRSAKLEAAKAIELLIAEIQAEAETIKEGCGEFDATAEHSYEHFGLIKETLKEINRTAVIGGGPAGLAAAYFLAKAGHSVTLFEKRDALGGIVKHVIPNFRIDDETIEKDISLVLATGVSVRLNTEVNDLEFLRTEGFEHLVIATGAWKPNSAKFKSDTKIMDALEFLHELKNDAEKVRIGKNVAVIGGGNTAMDTARAAIRCKGVESVSLVYRRTKRYMPADYEEIELALEEGVVLYELLTPTKLEDGELTCTVMKLGNLDPSGRHSPVPTLETFVLSADTVISATGNSADTKLYDNSECKDDIYVIGDAAQGPATIAEAIADATECVKEILTKNDTNPDARGDSVNLTFGKYTHLNISDDMNAVKCKKGDLFYDTNTCSFSELCLECATICELCVDVCPNRANISINIGGRAQIIHIDFMCNECGNCETFCPYNSAPYLDKFTYFIYKEDFVNSKNPGFWPGEEGEIHLRLDGEVSIHSDATEIPKDIWRMIKAFVLRVS